jgi:hypothetical protein
MGATVSSSLAETVSVAFDQYGKLYMSTRELPDGTEPIEATIRELVGGPTSEEAAEGVVSAIPAGTQVVALTVDSGGVIVDLSPEVLAGLTEAVLDNIQEQLRISLTPFEELNFYRLTCNGAELSTYLPQGTPVARPKQAGGAVMLATTGLAGRKITIGPSHGRYYNGSGWYWMRSDPCGFGEAVLEDTNSIRLMQFLRTYLEQDNATVYVHRDLNESDCCNTATGLPWWKMATHYWLRNQGLPCSVWAAYSGDCTSADGAVDRNSDDLWSRPLYADYVGSDIYLACHTNAGGSGAANGTETFRYSSMEHSEHVENSLALATAVQASVIDAIRTSYDSSWSNRGVKDSNFAEIRKPNQPAILIELGFHDNCTRDGVALTDNYFRSLAEWGLYKGICDYFGTTPTWDKYSCEYVSDTIPTTMEQGNYYPVSITFRNRGVVWKSAYNFFLGAVDDSDPLTTTTRVSPTGEVKPGETFTFSFTMRPVVAGTFTTDWRMLREGAAWFGPTLTKTVEVTTNPDTEPPSVPTNLTATAINPTKVQLGWTASTDNYVVNHYDVRRDGVVLGTSTTTSYTDTTAVAGATYSYDVQACDNVPDQCSGFSVPASVTMPLTDEVSPSTPTGLTATVLGPTSVRLNWTASTDNTAVTGYNIRRNGAALTTSTTTTFTDTVAERTTYAYEVQAYDAAGNVSGWSSTASVTTPGMNVVVFSDGFNGNLGNWTQGSVAFTYSTAQNHGTYTGSGCAYGAAGTAALMNRTFARPFAQGKVSGWFYDSTGGYKSGTCGTSFRQSLSLRDTGGATMMWENEFYSPTGVQYYCYRLLGTPYSNTHPYYATRYVTSCSPAWIHFETTLSPSASSGTVQFSVTDPGGTKNSAALAYQTNFYNYGAGRVQLGLASSTTSTSAYYWDDISFEAAAPGAPTMGTPSAITVSRVQWNFAPVDNYAFGFDVADDAGTIKSPQFSADGWLKHGAIYWAETGLAANTQYTRKVRAWNGTLNSDYSATVSACTLSRPPSASYVTADKTAACVGDSVTWFAVGGFGPGTVQSYLYAWDQNPTYTFTGTEDTWSMDTLLTQVTASGTWYLHLKGFNAAGVANGTYDAAITMQPATTVTGEPANATICTGASATFAVTATGANLTYRWQKNGTDLAEGGHYAGVASNTLTVSSTDADDLGSYTCVVTGACSSVATSNAATLAFKPGPTIGVQPVGHRIASGAATLTVEASGEGVLSYQWRKDQVTLADGGSIAGATSATLTIDPMSAADAGSYDVVVTDACGVSVTSNAVLLCAGASGADLDQDCDADGADFTLFSGCISGPSLAHDGSAVCQEADLDDDNDVDQVDFGVFQRCLSGENVMMDSACRN